MDFDTSEFSVFETSHKRNALLFTLLKDTTIPSGTVMYDLVDCAFPLFENPDLGELIVRYYILTSLEIPSSLIFESLSHCKYEFRDKTYVGFSKARELWRNFSPHNYDSLSEYFSDPISSAYYLSILAWIADQRLPFSDSDYIDPSNKKVLNWVLFSRLYCIVKSPNYEPVVHKQVINSHRLELIQIYESLAPQTNTLVKWELFSNALGVQGYDAYESTQYSCSRNSIRWSRLRNPNSRMWFPFDDYFANIQNIFSEEWSHLWGVSILDLDISVITRLSVNEEMEEVSYSAFLEGVRFSIPSEPSDNASMLAFYMPGFSENYYDFVSQYTDELGCPYPFLRLDPVASNPTFSLLKFIFDHKDSDDLYTNELVDAAFKRHFVIDRMCLVTKITSCKLYTKFLIKLSEFVNMFKEELPDSWWFLSNYDLMIFEDKVDITPNVNKKLSSKDWKRSTVGNFDMYELFDFSNVDDDVYDFTYVRKDLTSNKTMLEQPGTVSLNTLARLLSNIEGRLNLYVNYDYVQEAFNRQFPILGYFSNVQTEPLVVNVIVDQAPLGYNGKTVNDAGILNTPLEFQSFVQKYDKAVFGLYKLDSQYIVLSPSKQNLSPDNIDEDTFRTWANQSPVQVSGYLFNGSRCLVTDNACYFSGTLTPQMWNQARQNYENFINIPTGMACYKVDEASILKWYRSNSDHLTRLTSYRDIRGDQLPLTGGSDGRKPFFNKRKDLLLSNTFKHSPYDLFIQFESTNFLVPCSLNQDNIVSNMGNAGEMTLPDFQVEVDNSIVKACVRGGANLGINDFEFKISPNESISHSMLVEIVCQDLKRWVNDPKVSIIKEYKDTDDPFMRGKPPFDICIVAECSSINENSGRTLLPFMRYYRGWYNKKYPGSPHSIVIDEKGKVSTQSGYVLIPFEIKTSSHLGGAHLYDSFLVQVANNRYAYPIELTRFTTIGSTIPPICFSSLFRLTKIISSDIKSKLLNDKLSLNFDI